MLLLHDLIDSKANLKGNVSLLHREDAMDISESLPSGFVSDEDPTKFDIVVKKF